MTDGIAGDRYEKLKALREAGTDGFPARVPKGVAVAVNGDVIPASDWSYEVTDGDEMDILIAVQGG